jgi:hypothetical protein
MEQFRRSHQFLQRLLECHEQEIFGGMTWSLMTYGSTVNGLSHNSDSDLDLTILIDDFEISHEVILRGIKRVLER